MLEQKIGSKMYLLAVMAALVLSSCASSRGVESEMPARLASPDAPQVAVLPFENLTDYPNADRILTRLVSAELYRQGLFRVREESRTSRELQDAQRGRGETSAVTLARQIANELGAEAVLMGSVTEYRYQHGLHEEPVVGLSMRMVRACDGRVIWASSRSSGGRGFLHRDSLNQAAQRVAQALAAELQQMDAALLQCAAPTADSPSPVSGDAAEAEGGS